MKSDGNIEENNAPPGFVDAPRTKSFTNLAAALGTGLAESMEDSLARSYHENTNLVRQTRHTASRLIGRSLRGMSANAASDTVQTGFTVTEAPDDQFLTSQQTQSSGRMSCPPDFDEAHSNDFRMESVDRLFSVYVANTNVYPTSSHVDQNAHTTTTNAEIYSNNVGARVNTNSSNNASSMLSQQLQMMTVNNETTSAISSSIAAPSSSNNEVYTEFGTNPSAELQLQNFFVQKPSRCLCIIVHTTPTTQNIQKIRGICESFGNLESFRSEFLIKKRILFVSYFSLRSAIDAMDRLSGYITAALNSISESRVRYCTELSASVEDNACLLLLPDSTIHINNLLQEATIEQIMSSYGGLQTIVEIGECQYQVHFYDSQDAKQALLELSNGVLPGYSISFGKRSSGTRERGRQLLSILSQWRLEGTGVQIAQSNLYNNTTTTVANALSMQQPSSRSSTPSGVVRATPPPVSHHPQQVPSRTPPPQMNRQHPNYGQPAQGYYSPTTSPSQQQQHVQLVVGPDGQYSYVVPYQAGLVDMSNVAPPLNQQYNPHGAYIQAPGMEYGIPRIVDGGTGSPGGSISSSPQTGVSYMSIPNMHRSGSHGSIHRGRNGGAEDTSLALSVEAILKEKDTRTSLMVRNIPNKYTQQMLLKEFTDAGHGPDKMDFFYLPIDFKNKCNRGYAFVNFVDYRDIIPFWQQYSGKHWRIFNSDKICDITYARIQGKAAMLKRFEHSALMDKDDEYRPLVFTSHGVNKGQREEFPHNPSCT